MKTGGWRCGKGLLYIPRAPSRFYMLSYLKLSRGLNSRGYHACFIVENCCGSERANYLRRLHSWLLVEPREESMFMWLQAHVSSFAPRGPSTGYSWWWDPLPGTLPRHSFPSVGYRCSVDCHLQVVLVRQHGPQPCRAWALRSHLSFPCGRV